MSALGLNLNRKFRNPALPKLVSWDHRATRDSLLSAPSLLTFQDHDDLDTVTKDSGTGQISKVEDLSGKGKHAISSGALRPIFNAGAFVDANGAPFVGGSDFDGTMEYTIAGLFQGRSKITLAVSFYVPDATALSRMFVSDRNTPGQNWYYASNALRSLSANVELTGLNTTLSPNWAIFTHNFATDEMSIISSLGSISASSATAAPTGDVILGGWSDGQEDNNMIGALSDFIAFDEDLSTNPLVLAELKEYLGRKTRNVSA